MVVGAPIEVSPPNERAALWSLMIGNIAIGAGVIAPAAMMNSLSSGLQVSIPEAGRLIAYGAVVLCIGAPLLAWLTTRMDRKTLLVLALVWFAVGHGASALAPDFDSLLIMRVLMISSAAVFTPQAAAAVSLFVSTQRRPGAITFVFMGWSIATALAIPLISLIAAQVGWRTAYWTLAGLSTAAALGVALTMPRGLRSAALSFAAWGNVLTNPAILLILSVTAVQLVGQFTLFPYLAPELKRLTGAGPHAIALMLALYGVAGFVGAAIIARVAPRLGAPASLVLCLGAVIAGLALWGLSATTPAGAAVAIFVWGLGFTAANSLQQARLITAAPMLASASVALNTSSIYVGQAIGTSIGGRLIEAHAPGLLAWTGFVFCGVALGLAVLVWRMFKA